MSKKKEQVLQELAVLKFKRDSLIKKINILHRLSVELATDSTAYDEFKVRFAELKPTYEAFSRCQLEVIKLSITVDATEDLSTYQPVIDEVDEQYYFILAAHDKFVTVSEPALNSTRSSELSPTNPQVKLPKIQLPSFNGHIKDWPHFKDLFCSLVHDNDSISPIEKFQYLLSCLCDEPHNLARTLPITAQNYSLVWEQLVSRYDDKRRLASYYLEEIIALPSLNVGSPRGLRQLLDICSENSNALNATQFPVDLGDFMLFHTVVQKLDKHTRQLFESKFSGTDFPTFQNLLSFLSDHCKALDAAQITNKENVSTRTSINTPKPRVYLPQSSNRQYPMQKNTYTSSVSSPRCTYCNESHTVYTCAKFSALPIPRRKDAVQAKGACFNCLSSGHMLDRCTSTSTCRTCGKRHHTLLHDELYGTQKKTAQVGIHPQVNKNPTTDYLENDKPIMSGYGSGTPRSDATVLLGTAAIQVSNSAGKFLTVRALIDPGSQASFITESCVHRLGLSRHKYNEPVLGLSQTNVTTIKGGVSCTIKPRFKHGPILNTNAIILPKITSPLPSTYLGPEVRKYFERFELSDPHFDVPGDIDFLLGADMYPDVFDGGRKSTPQGMPTLFHSIFGWVLIGPTKLPRITEKPLTSHLVISDSFSLENCMKKFWEVEEIPHQKSQLSPQDELCEEVFSSTHERDPSGRYVVKLPFKEESPNLGESLGYAERCFHHLERRFLKNTDLQVQYSNFMEEYETLGHMKKLNVSDPQPKYFIPHHAVFKPEASGSKIRVVFNASAKTTNGISLNDQLCVGPKLQNEVTHILSRFRLFPVVFVTDICKMYRQILVNPADQVYQAILWRSSFNEPINVYLLTTVTYGVTSSPYLAIRTLHQLALDEEKQFPNAAQVLIRDSYVDDLLVGCESIESAQMLKTELTALLQSGGFELKKWATNTPELLSDIPDQNKEISFQSDQSENAVVKVLGIKWLPTSDCFSYSVLVEETTPTKRHILSMIARLFDPLGWVSPVVFFAKLLIQKLWLLGVNWDDLPPTEILKQWHEFEQQLPQLQTLRIPRFAILSNSTSVQLHGFSDASTNGYAAVLYLRSEDVNGHVSVQLVTAKSRVAPLKTISIPRLELCGALLLARLLKSYQESIASAVTNLTVFAWSDSMVVLSWIHTPSYQLKTFVANRVSEIQDTVDPSCWKHTPTSSNPADCASRGLLPQNLLSHSLWWNGPEWLLSNSDDWPSQPTSNIPQTELPELKTKCISNVVTEPPVLLDFLDRFSTFTHLKRVTAYVLRFIHNCRVSNNERTIGYLSTSELKSAEIVCIRSTQKFYFTHEINCLEQNKPCSPSIQKLVPFIDEKGILRVGGRLRNSSIISYDSRHPMLLPAKARLSELIIDHFHRTHLHVGPRTLQSLLQQRFWITSARNAIRKRIHKCVTCARFKASNLTPFMADLPAVRVQPSRPFLHVGVDFGGPFLIKSDRSRKPQIKKAYLALFICLSTKAIHLEVVSDLTTQAFIAALNRFISRRGICSDIYSDRGTTFIGVKNELNQLITTAISSEEVHSNLSNRGIKWHFNPPYAPNFGGIWEAGIKSAKHLLKRTVGEQKLTFEELATLFSQIEAILNSRPLCSLSTDPHETDVLTPGHFLIGEPLISLPHPDLSPVPENRLSRWQLLQQLKQHFWKRWSVEYLHSLQQREKWNIKTPVVQPNDLVLIKEQNLPPQTWMMGRIIETLPSRDGTIRIVKLKTSKGVLTRPVSKLCPLPTKD